MIHYFNEAIPNIMSQGDVSNSLFTQLQPVIKSRATGLSRNESNLLLIKLNLLIKSNKIHELMNMDHIRALLFRMYKLSFIRSLSFALSKDEISTLLSSQMHFAAMNTKQLHEKDPPLLIPIHTCTKILEMNTLLNLNRAFICSILYWSQDCIQENLIHRKSFAQHAALLIHKMHSSEYLESRAYVLENSNLSELQVMDGLTPEMLETYLSQSCRSVADANGDIHIDTFRAILRETPKLYLTSKEVLIFESNFTNGHPTKVHYLPILPLAYSILYDIRKECKIGRRIGLAALQCIRNKKIKESFKKSLMDTAEHLLGAVKIQNRSGIIHATFPDAAKYCSAEVDNSIIGKRSIQSTFKDVRIAVQNHQEIKSIPVTLHASLGSEGIGLPTWLTISVNQASTSEFTFAAYTARVPSIAEVDEEVAEAFCSNAVQHVYAMYDGGVDNRISLRL